MLVVMIGLMSLAKEVCAFAGRQVRNRAAAPSVWKTGAKRLFIACNWTGQTRAFEWITGRALPSRKLPFEPPLVVPYFEGARALARFNVTMRTALNYPQLLTLSR